MEEGNEMLVAFVAKSGIRNCRQKKNKRRNKYSRATIQIGEYRYTRTVLKKVE